MEDHKTYLSYSERGWILIHMGSPLCDYKKTKTEVMKAVEFFKCKLPDVTWFGETGEWILTTSILEK
jgi:hypothetical protein